MIGLTIIFGIWFASNSPALSSYLPNAIELPKITTVPLEQIKLMSPQLPSIFNTGFYISTDYPQCYLQLKEDYTFEKHFVYGEYKAYGQGEWQVKGTTLTLITKGSTLAVPWMDYGKQPIKYKIEKGLEDWVVESSRLKDPQGLYWHIK